MGSGGMKRDPPVLVALSLKLMPSKSEPAGGARGSDAGVVGGPRGISLRMEGPGPMGTGGSIVSSVGSTAHSDVFKLPKASKMTAAAMIFLINLVLSRFSAHTRQT